MTSCNVSISELDYPSVNKSSVQAFRQGDARSLPIIDNTVDLIVTSPPYWQKRDYGHEDQIGQEETPEEYVSTMMDAFDEWERVLRDTGTIILNIGDTYRQKSRVGIPWKLAEAASNRGWLVRSEIIWKKPSGVPNPTDNRFTARHECIFHFTPQDNYYFDKFGYESVYKNTSDVWEIPHDQNDAHLAPFPAELVERTLIAACPPAVCPSCGKPRQRKVTRGLAQLNEERPQARRAMQKYKESNLSEEHIKAIQATGISDVGKAREIQNGTGINSSDVINLAQEAKEVLGGYFREFTFPVKTTEGWTQCDCTSDAIPGLVLDPFAGSGTTIEVAEKMDLSAVGIDINPPATSVGSQNLKSFSNADFLVDTTSYND